MGLQLMNIVKAYGDNLVLDGLTTKIGNGIYGFLGANGVGKTTLFKIISGFITKYQGTVVYPPVAGKREVLLGFLPQSFSGYPDMTICQFLAYLGGVKAEIPKPRLQHDIDEKLELFNLSKLRNKKLKKLSGGQLRRVGLAQAFLLNPKIVMLDEPTTGLDPTERIKFKNYITAAGHDQTILVSTHIVSDLEYIAKEIFILKDGHFVMSGSEEELVRQCAGLVWEAGFQNEQELHRQLADAAVSMIYDSGRQVKARIISRTRPVAQAVPVTPSLNDVYLVNFRKEARAHA